MLRRFWFNFENARQVDVLGMGCGITAYDLPDAYRFLKEQVFPIYGEWPVAQVAEDIDVSTLEVNHIRPNMGNPAVRGVWFPLL